MYKIRYLLTIFCLGLGGMVSAQLSGGDYDGPGLDLRKAMIENLDIQNFRVLPHTAIDYGEQVIIEVEPLNCEFNDDYISTYGIFSFGDKGAITDYSFFDFYGGDGAKSVDWTNQAFQVSMLANGSQRLKPNNGICDGCIVVERMDNPENDPLLRASYNDHYNDELDVQYIEQWCEELWLVTTVNGVVVNIVYLGVFCYGSGGGGGPDGGGGGDSSGGDSGADEEEDSGNDNNQGDCEPESISTSVTAVIDRFLEEDYHSDVTHDLFGFDVYGTTSISKIVTCNFDGSINECSISSSASTHKEGTTIFITFSDVGSTSSYLGGGKFYDVYRYQVCVGLGLGGNSGIACTTYTQEFSWEMGGDGNGRWHDPCN